MQQRHTISSRNSSEPLLGAPSLPTDGVRRPAAATRVGDKLTRSAGGHVARSIANSDARDHMHEPRGDVGRGFAR